MQKLYTDHKQIQHQNHDAENQPFTFAKSTKNTDTSLEASLTEEYMDTRVHSQAKTLSLLDL